MEDQAAQYLAEGLSGTQVTTIHLQRNSVTQEIQNTIKQTLNENSDNINNICTLLTSALNTSDTSIIDDKEGAIEDIYRYIELIKK